jgi:hypothetical protein
MDVNDNACSMNYRAVWTSIASKLAPTEDEKKPAV